MIAWRKKPEGFEWHRYIRTAVKVRRENRRRRIDDARQAAAQQLGAAGAALAAGSKAAGAAARDGARAGLGVAGQAAQGAGNAAAAWARRMLRWLGAAALVVMQKLAVALRPLTEMLGRTNIGGPLALAGAIALGSGIGRYRSMGADGETLIALGIGLILFIAALPMLSRLTGIGVPSLGALGLSTRMAPRVGVAAAVVALVAGIAWFVSRGAADWASLGMPLFGSAKPIEGRAQAVSGDLLRVGGRTVRLAGIEAPEAEQRCGRGGRQWRCGAAAEAALARLVSGRSVRCTVDGSDGAGRPAGHCTVGKTDINGELVRRGHVFAEQGFFARYASQEQEAQAAKAGLWSGDAERPSEYRAKAWEEAKRSAPEGCPIKGLVRGGDRIYVLPGAPDYGRGRVEKSRGGRWFCSEREAVSAGFKAAQRG
jgi:endonuclease YncB( thermonuclease family)